MSQEIGQTELQEKTRRLLGGPLKHIRAAALAAALLPLASMAVTPAAAQTSCPSGICPPPPPPPSSQPGTGTPGYWKNHASAWPSTITVANVTYTKEQAIALLGRVGSDKTITMFSSLVPAKLNVAIGNDGSCVTEAIETANSWLIANPVGTNVAGSSLAWAIGEPTHITLDTYNNGLLYNNGVLCAPHRQ